jgi:hypothetical protein
MTTFAGTQRLRELTAGLTLADFGRRPGAETIILRNTRPRVAEHGGDEVADAFETWAMTRAELGELVNYHSSTIADRLRTDMNRINAILDDADLCLCKDAIANLPDKDTVDPGDRWLRRVFNNGHTDFRHGGRLTGGFWMDLPKVVRRRTIIIGDDRVIELDFNAMMPRLLYAHVGQPYPADQDPYAIPGVPPGHRDGVKKLFSSLTFGSKAFEKWPRGCAKLFPSGTEREAVISLLRRQHAPIAHKLGTLVGSSYSGRRATSWSPCC